MSPLKRRGNTAKLSDREIKALRHARVALERNGLNNIPPELGSYGEITNGTVVELGCALVELYLGGKLVLKESKSVETGNE